MWSNNGQPLEEANLFQALKALCARQYYGFCTNELFEKKNLREGLELLISLLVSFSETAA